MELCTGKLIESLSNSDGDGHENRRHLKICSRAAMNLIALILSRSIRQMLAIFWNEFQKSVSKLRKRKREFVVLCSRPPQNVKSRRICAVTAKKCTKRRDALAELLFCQSKPLAFLSFSLTLPSSLLKFPIVWWSLKQMIALIFVRPNDQCQNILY